MTWWCCDTDGYATRIRRPILVYRIIIITINLSNGFVSFVVYRKLRRASKTPAESLINRKIGRFRVRARCKGTSLYSDFCYNAHDRSFFDGFILGHYEINCGVKYLTRFSNVQTNCIYDTCLRRYSVIQISRTLDFGTFFPHYSLYR